MTLSTYAVKFEQLPNSTWKINQFQLIRHPSYFCEEKEKFKILKTGIGIDEAPILSKEEKKNVEIIWIRIRIDEAFILSKEEKEKFLHFLNLNFAVTHVNLGE